MNKRLLGMGALTFSILPMVAFTSCAKKETDWTPIEPSTPIVPEEEVVEPTTPKEDAMKYFNETKNLVEEIVEEQVKTAFKTKYEEILILAPLDKYDYSPNNADSIDATTRMFKKATTFVMNSNGDFEMVYSSANLNEITLSVKMVALNEELGSVFKWEKPQNDKPFNIVDGKLIGV